MINMRTDVFSASSQHDSHILKAYTKQIKKRGLIMYYKKIILLCLLPLFLFASEKEVDTKKLLKYSSLPINQSVHVYAAKSNMQNFKDDNAYSVGLMHQSKGSHTEFAVGYMQPVDQVNALFDLTAVKILSQQDEGVLFFMNHHF